KTPYQTQIDLSEPAFKCSCPSRKFPCKHALGLFLLLANQPKSFTQTNAPQWVEEWIASRAKRAQQQATKQAKAAGTDNDAIVDAAAQQKRVAARNQKVTAGINELETWLGDLIRHGLASAQTQPLSFWEQIAKRLIDAQAPGLARLVRELPGVAASGEGWPARLLERIAKLYLLVEGYKRLDTLPQDTQADIRTMIGWTQNQDELLSAEGIRDRWQVVGQRVTQEDRLRVQSTWLWGSKSNRAALLLHFAYGNQPLDASLVLSTVIDAEIVFFPSAYPMRAIIKQRYATVHTLDSERDSVMGYEAIDSAIGAYAAALGRNPWIERFPFLLRNVTPERHDEHWLVRDANNAVLPIALRFEQPWELLAVSGGHAIDLFGEWDSDHLLPLSVWAEGRFVKLI
ncbi:MAG TPA: SWIM zinc finger family protein, partial [Blastocatellia bacterium]|nr:SWIM zinc finger family protein [Blastocatellia bacterium]